MANNSSADSAGRCDSSARTMIKRARALDGHQNLSEFPPPRPLRLKCSLFLQLGVYLFNVSFELLHLDVSRPEESTTDEMLATIEVESQRRLRREAQRSRRARENSVDRDSRQRKDAAVHKAARNAATHGLARDSTSSQNWWDHLAQLNRAGTKPSVGLHWNRTCKHCGIKVGNH